MRRRRNTPSHLHLGTERRGRPTARRRPPRGRPPWRASAFAGLRGSLPGSSAHYRATEGFPVQHAGILPAVISARAVRVFTYLIAALWLAIMSGANAQNAAGGVSPAVGSRVTGERPETVAQGTGSAAQTPVALTPGEQAPAVPTPAAQTPVAQAPAAAAPAPHRPR